VACVYSLPVVRALQADDHCALINLERGDPPEGAGRPGKPARNMIDDMRRWLATETYQRHLFSAPVRGTPPMQVS
jgi:hypothetical protein